MLSDVVLVGTLQEIMPSGFRYLLIDCLDVLKNERKQARIPLLYWSKSKNNTLNAKRKGSKALIKGRIEADSNIGLFVLVEIIEIIK